MKAEPATPPSQVRWQSAVFDPSGYADEARYFLRHLAGKIPIRLEPIGRLSRKFFEEMDPGERGGLQRLMAETPASGHIQLTIAPAYAFQRDPRAKFCVGRTTFETDRLPAEWVAACNRLDEIWVPTAFNVETFRRAGVTAPIQIVPQGVDVERFHPELKPLPIPGRRKLAFLSVFEWIHRKGWDVLLRAWAAAFRPDDDVCLIIRSYLPNLTEGKSSTAVIDERIDAFLRTALGKTREGVAPIIVLGEQLAQLEMPALYASADAFVLPTRGEGWGRPFIEAMACGLPVIGTDWGAQLAFMNRGNSLLLRSDGLETVDDRMEFPFYRGHQWAKPSAEHLIELLAHVAGNPAAAKNLGAVAARDMRENWQWPRAAAIMRERLAALESGHKISTTAAAGRPVVSWEGSFLDHGSLSHVNRELVAALQTASEFTVKPVTNGAPAAKDAASCWPDLMAGISQSPAPDAVITVRHSWPPNWRRPRGGKLVVIQPWEFGFLPEDWVRQSREVDEFWVPSNYVRGVYQASGVPEHKVLVVPNGVDTEQFNPEAAPLKIATSKKFKFLFVGGTIGRKGPDVLLDAYLKNFSAADDVCLVIKDFGGGTVYAGQTFEAQIRAAQARPDAPEIVYLNTELPPSALPGLYTACDCFVMPYRGEGFGLPVLEAMACGLPVITTAGGATDDFVRDEFAWRIPAARRVFGRMVSGMKLAGEGWLLEPNAQALGEFMRQAFANPGDARARGKLAAEFAREHFTWQHAAAIACRRLGQLTKAPTIPATRLQSITVKAPPVASLGRLDEARAQLGRRNFPVAWQLAMAALACRPFHPEGFLLLAEIALAAGDSVSARLCAQRARGLAPGWSAPAQFGKRQMKGAADLPWLELPKPARFALSVCLIVKNEEKFLRRCLESVRGLNAQIVVVDTGSTDGTVNLARELGAEVHTFAWCDDFSAARNAALAHATGDWVLMLDADEELPPAEHDHLRADLRRTEVMAYRLPLANAGQEAEGRHFVPRLFRNAPGIFYHGRVHEQVFPSLLPMCRAWGLPTRMGTAQILHHGYTKEMVRDRDKIARNLKLLRQAVIENPADVNLVMNLGLELVRSDDLAGGIAKYREAFDMMSAQPADEVVPELREVLLTQFTAQLYKIRAHEEAVRALVSPLARQAGLTASLHFALGLACFELRQYAEAAGQMRSCLAKRSQPALSPINTDILGVAPQHCLALSLARAGDPAAAEKAFQAALGEMGRLEEVRLDYARFLTNQNRPVDALRLLHEIVAQNGGCAIAWRLGGQIALGDTQYHGFALDWTAEAMRQQAGDDAITAQRAEALMLANETGAAADLWEKVWLARRAPAALAALILCEVAESLPTHAPDGEAEELAVSRAFILWYQKLIAFHANSLLVRLNSQTETIARVIPTAGRMLEAALTGTPAGAA